VYGNDYRADNFLSSVIRDAIRGRVVLESHPSSAKDYVGIDEVVELLLGIGTTGRERVYNVASGQNTSHEDILAVLATETGCRVELDTKAPALRFPPIDIDRIATEFHFAARPVVEAIAPLVEDFRVHRNTWETT
jgi:hypothetical protein